MDTNFGRVDKWHSSQIFMYIKKHFIKKRAFHLLPKKHVEISNYFTFVSMECIIQIATKAILSFFRLFIVAWPIADICAKNSFKEKKKKKSLCKSAISRYIRIG